LGCGLVERLQLFRALAVTILLVPGLNSIIITPKPFLRIVKTITFALDLALVAVGGIAFLFSALYWTAVYGSGIPVGQENWSSIFMTIGLVSLGTPGVLSLRGQTWNSLIVTFRTAIPLVPVGILLTFATGFVGGSVEGVNPGGSMALNYGLPFSWKIVLSSCPPPCVQASGTIYNPLFFALDSLFFIVPLYLLLREYRRGSITGKSTGRFSNWSQPRKASLSY
jgi:hypothetical protein